MSETCNNDKKVVVQGDDNIIGEEDSCEVASENISNKCDDIDIELEQDENEEFSFGGDPLVEEITSDRILETEDVTEKDEAEMNNEDSNDDGSDRNVDSPK